MLVPIGDFIPARGVYHSDLWKLNGICVDLNKITDITMNSNHLYIEKDNGNVIKLELDMNLVNPKLGLAYLREVVENFNNLLSAQ